MPERGDGTTALSSAGAGRHFTRHATASVRTPSFAQIATAGIGNSSVGGGVSTM